MAVQKKIQVAASQSPSDSDMIVVYNRSKQTISLQVKPPGGDFFLHEQAVHLRPNKSVRLPKSFANTSQIRNLQAKRKIQVISGDITPQDQQQQKNRISIPEPTPQ